MQLLRILAIVPAMTLCIYALPTGDASVASAAVVRRTLDKRACNAIYRRVAQDEDGGAAYPEIAMVDCAKLTAGDTAEEEDDASILPRGL